MEPMAEPVDGQCHVLPLLALNRDFCLEDDSCRLYSTGALQKLLGVLAWMVK